jgi:hypothetical protein
VEVDAAAGVVGTVACGWDGLEFKVAWNGSDFTTNPFIVWWTLAVAAVGSCFLCLRDGQFVAWLPVGTLCIVVLAALCGNRVSAQANERVTNEAMCKQVNSI